MFLLRKLGALLRGAATPFQVVLACVLGALLGFAPGFMRAPALVVGLVLLLVVFNANLALAGLVAGAAKLASLALMPVSFALGRMLLDGPTRGLFAAAINAPVLAFCGFEWYVGAGGLVLGLALGLLAGFVVAAVLGRFRRAMATLESTSGAYEKAKGSKLLRFLMWIVVGPKHGAQTYGELLSKKVGNPIRVAGLVVALLVVGGLWFGAGKLAGPYLTSALKDGLERANGATVDVGRVELALAENRLAIHELALADAKALDRDLFRATLLECDLSGADLLRKRLKLDRVVARDATQGARRATPGVRTAPEPQPSPPPPAADADDKTLDEWLESAQTWKARLEQAKSWLDRLKRAPSAAAEDESTLRDRLEREVEAHGWRNVAASHLIEGAPLFELILLQVDGMKCDALDGGLADLRAEHLSTNPRLVDGAPTIALTTQDGRIAIDASLAGEARTPGRSAIALRCTGLPTASVMAALGVKCGAKTLEGGTVDVGFRLSFGPGQDAAFDGPLAVVVRDATITLPKLGSAKVKELAIPLSLRGPLDNPRVRLDAEQFAKDLAAAGATELSRQLEAKANDAIEKKSSELEQKAKDKIDEQAKRALESLDPFGKKKKKKD